MWVQEEFGRVRHPFEPLILAATLALIPVLIIENDAQSEGWREFAKVANWVIWVIFAAELALVLVVAPKKKKALRPHWLDAAVLVVTIPFFGEALSSLRLVRLVIPDQEGVVSRAASDAVVAAVAGDESSGEVVAADLKIVVGAAVERVVAASAADSDALAVALQGVPSWPALDRVVAAVAADGAEDTVVAEKAVIAETSQQQIVAAFSRNVAGD
jgi:hypothetical protein